MEKDQNLIIYDTSFLVNHSNHDIGAFVSMCNLQNKIGDDNYTQIVPEPVRCEAVSLFNSPYNGSPRMSATTLKDIHKSVKIDPLTDEIRSPDNRRLSRGLWESSSRKAFTSLSPSNTDLDTITYARKMAEEGKIVFVFTYDDDIASPLTSLKSAQRGIHVVGYTQANNFSVIARKSDIFLTEDVFHSLWAMPPTHNAYMLTSKFNIGDIRAPLVWKVCAPLEGRKIEEGPIKRIPTTIVEMEDLPYKDRSNYVLDPDTEVILDKNDEERIENRGKILLRQYKNTRFIQVVRNRRQGLLLMWYSDLTQSGNESEIPTNHLDWFLLPTYFMTGYHLDWYANISKRMLEYRS